MDEVVELRRELADCKAELRALRTHVQKLTGRVNHLNQLNQLNQLNSTTNEGTMGVYVVDDMGLELPIEELEIHEEVSEEVEEDLEDMICFDTKSAWSLPLVLSLESCFESCFGIFLLLMNGLMQVLFVVILVSPEFLGSDLSESLESAKVWRRAFAHDLQFVDLAERSLASRVCAEDSSLIFSQQQLDLISHINSYLGLETTSFQTSKFQPGLLLSVLCVLLWNICVFEELRSICYGLRGIFLGDAGLSRPRTLAMTVVCLCRGAVAWALLLSGSVWLGYTIEITELLLNSVALEAVLHVDDFIFGALVPTNLQQKIKFLKPVKIKKSRHWPSLENFFLALLLLGALSLPYFVILVPLREDMLSVKTAMCGGNLHFAMGHRDGLLWNVPTTSLEERNLTYAEVGVEELAFPSQVQTPVSFPFLQPSLSLARQRLYQEYQDYKVENHVCVEHGERNVNFIEYVRGAGFRLGKPGATTCAELAHFCSLDGPEEWLDDIAIVWLRKACPKTCGCSTPLSSPVMKTPLYGCPRACILEQYGFNHFQGSPFFGQAPNFTTGCKDVAPTSEALQDFWRRYVIVMSYELGYDLRQDSGLMQAMEWGKLVGCPFFAVSPTGMGGELACRGNSRYLPLAWLCPETCGCASSGDSARDHFCFAYDYCPFHVPGNESAQAWNLIRKYDLLKTLMNPELLSYSKS